jgi:hypothetical protein
VRGVLLVLAAALLGVLITLGITTLIYSSRCVPFSGGPQLVQLPKLNNAWQIQTTCNFPRSKNVSIALRLFYTEWVREFGDKDRKVSAALQKLMVSWGKKKKPSRSGFTISGEYVEEGDILGLALSPTYVWVWEGEYERLGATALVHELVHVALWAEGDHGDPDHEGDLFPGWTKNHTKFIKKVNQTLAKLDI